MPHAGRSAAYADLVASGKSCTACTNLTAIAAAYRLPRIAFGKAVDKPDGFDLGNGTATSPRNSAVLESSTRTGRWSSSFGIGSGSDGH
jgi:hypothetical protein